MSLRLARDESPCHQPFRLEAYSAGTEITVSSSRISTKARRAIRAADEKARYATTPATARSGQGVPEIHTPAPARITPILAMQSLRVQSQTDMARLSARAVPVEQHR